MAAASKRHAAAAIAVKGIIFCANIEAMRDG